MTAQLRTRPPVIWLTCLDGRDHAVRDEEFAACQSGVYEAVCGARLLPASSHAAPRPLCPACGRFVLAWKQCERLKSPSARLRPSGPHRHGRRSLVWARLCPWSSDR